MTRLAATLIASLGLAASGATAQEQVFTDVELRFTQISVDDAELQTSSFFGSAGYQFGAFELVTSLGFQQIEFDGFDSDVTTFMVNLGYDITPQFSVDASFGQIAIEDFDTSFSEISGTYDAGTFWITLFYGQSDEGFLGDEDGLYGATGGYDFGQGTEVALTYITPSEGDAEDLTVLSILHQTDMLTAEAEIISGDGITYILSGVSYEVAPNIAVLFDYDLFDFDFGDVQTIAIGGSYEVTPGLAVFAKVGRTEFSDEGETTENISIGLTYATGNRSLRTDNTFSRIIEPLYFDTDFPSFF